MAKKIEKFMLSKELQDQIDQVSNLSQIHLDQLDPSLKTLLTNIGTASQGVISYDDSEIRNRVIALEKNSATKTGWFNKTSDKLAKSMLDEELSNLIIEMQDFSDALFTKLNKTDADSRYRLKEDKIQLSDLSDEFSNNVRSINNKVNALNTTFAGMQFVANDVENLKNIINDLPNTAITQSAADLRYRKLDTKINLGDLGTDLQPHVRELVNNSQKLANVALKSDVDACRKKDTKIQLSDLEDSIITKINIVDQLSTNINTRITDLVANSFDTGFEKALVKTFVGEYTILNKQEFQDYIQKVLTDNHTDIITDNRATFGQIFFAIYKELNKNNADLTFLSNVLNGINSQLANIQTQFAYVTDLKNKKAATHITTLANIFGLPKNVIDDYSSVGGEIQEVSSPASTTILQADTIKADFTQDGARTADTYIGVATNAIHDSDVLTYLDLKNVTSINANAVKTCPNLNTILLPSIKTIAAGAFVGCDNIALIVLPEGYVINHNEGFPAMARVIRVVGKA